MNYSLLLCLPLVFLFISPGNADQASDKKKESDNVYAPLIDQGLEVVEFDVDVDGRQVPAVIASPSKEKIHSDPLLLLTIGGANTHLLPPNDLPAKYFLERGHRAVSLSVPSVASSLGTFGEMAAEGPDPTLEFIEEAQAVIDYCIVQGWAKPDRIVVTGISRYAYMAFRLMAADERLNIGGGFAPVTDWRDLSEIEPMKDKPEIIDLRLSKFADDLSGKKIYMAIGNHDDRVGTLSCCQFFLDLNTANEKKGLSRSLVDFFVTPDLGHRCGDEWYERGMEILLNTAQQQD
ncbi:alpha/beta hydrolase family protein [Bythopirellula goksoeyrii]|nr:hypothetical protein [Bythopirellula goksoeyrii]